MFITRVEINQDKDLASKIKNWAGSLNLAAKSPGVPTFQLSGPCNLKIRLRRTAPGVSPLTSYDFRGGEEFRISSVVLEKDMALDGIAIRTIFTPVDLMLALEIASMSMPLQDAIEVFGELEAWVDLSVVETNAAQREKAHEKAEIEKLPTVEEVRASETWGAW